MLASIWKTLIINDCQISTSQMTKYHLIWVKIVFIKNLFKKLVLIQMLRKNNRRSLLVGMWTCLPILKTIWRFLKKLKYNCMWSSNYNTRYPKNTYKAKLKDICTLMLTTVLFIIDKIWQYFKYPKIDERWRSWGRYSNVVQK